MGMREIPPEIKIVGASSSGDLASLESERSFLEFMLEDISFAFPGTRDARVRKRLRKDLANIEAHIRAAGGYVW